LSDAATRTTGRIRSDASPNYLGGECEIVIRTYVDPGGLTRPTGDLGLQLDRRTDHVETWSPPYVPCRKIVPAVNSGSTALGYQGTEDNPHRPEEFPCPELSQQSQP
jgi:hypothetical protein